MLSFFLRFAIFFRALLPAFVGLTTTPASPAAVKVLAALETITWRTRFFFALADARAAEPSGARQTKFS